LLSQVGPDSDPKVFVGLATFGTELPLVAEERGLVDVGRHLLDGDAPRHLWSETRWFGDAVSVVTTGDAAESPLIAGSARPVRGGSGRPSATRPKSGSTSPERLAVAIRSITFRPAKASLP
jgi:hypothetical protein